MADLDLEQRQQVRAMIQQEAVTLAYLDTQIIDSAMIASLSATKLTAGTIGAERITLGAGGQILSSNYVAGSAGWSILGDGSAEFSNVTVRGTIHASSGTFSGTITATGTISGGTISGATITGSTIQTATTDPRIILGPNTVFPGVPEHAFEMWPSGGTTVFPAWLAGFLGSTGRVTVQLVSPRRSGDVYAGVFAWSATSETGNEVFTVGNTVALRATGRDANGHPSGYEPYGDLRAGLPVGANAPGLNLTGASNVIVSRQYSPFTSGKFQGAGRFGLIQEGTAAIDLAIANLAGAHWGVNKYNADSTIARRIVDGVADQATRYGATGIGLDVVEAVGGGGLAESRTETYSGGGFRRHTAFDHFNTSDRKLKGNVRPPPTGLKHAAIVANAPIFHWEDVDGEERCGPLAEDLPALVKSKTRLTPRQFERKERVERVKVTRPGGAVEEQEQVITEDVAVEVPPTEVELVSTSSLIGVLWGAVRELSERLAAVERRP